VLWFPLQFLALECSESVPEHVGQLARSHEAVTLLFMDICGFTAMSKVRQSCKPAFSPFALMVLRTLVAAGAVSGQCWLQADSNASNLAIAQKKSLAAQAWLP